MEEIEIWKDIEGYEGLYQVSNFGKVKSLSRTIIYKDSRKKILHEKILKPSKDKDGYLRLELCNSCKIKNYFVHRLVALAFIPNPDNLPMINHKDESRDNNCVENLEWCDCKFNNNYGTRNIRLSKSKKGKPLTEETKQKMRKPKSAYNFIWRFK